jgi:hypothetical protein
MGRDFTLSDKHPSIIINGRKYHYGLDVYRQYMVESAHYGKDYWYFKEKEDLQAFLINLPESADRDLRLKLHPDWRDVTPEQRDAYFEQDKLLFRAWAAEKTRNGTAQSFNMDLQGEHGPYEPQQIESRSDELPLARVERQLRDWKTYHSWDRVLSEAGKLRVLEGELDWTGVDERGKEAVLAREVDFKKISGGQLQFVYEDIAFEHGREVDSRTARQLFDRFNEDSAALGETPLERAARQVAEDRSEPGGTQAGKLYRLESRVDWMGIDDGQKEELLRGAIDFASITREGLNTVYESLVRDLAHEVDERPARRLFDKANYTQAVATADRIPLDEQLQKVRPVTRNLIESVMLDTWPRDAAIVDFGIDSQQHYDALYYPIRNDEMAPLVLDAAMGHGEKLTELARGAPSNPHKAIEFHTSWDVLLGRERPAAERPETASKPNVTSPAEIVEKQNGPDSDGPDRGHPRRRGR